MQNIQTYSEKVGLNEKSAKKAIETNRIRNELNEQGEIFIPDDEIKPLKKSQIQSVIWAILRYKNEPLAVPDLSCLQDVRNSEILSVFKQLAFRKYIDGVDNSADLNQCFCNCRVTKKGFNLVERSPLPGAHISKQLIDATASFAIQGVLSWLSALLLSNSISS